jgi:hypothetical protein
MLDAFARESQPMDDERLKTWEILFQRALILIDDVRAKRAEH